MKKRKKAYSKRKFLEQKWKKIALERIEILEEMKRRKPEFAERYDELIYRIKKKCRMIENSKKS